MSITIETLTYRTAADLAGVGRDFARLDNMARAAAIKVERAIGSIRPPALTMPRIDFAGPAKGAGGLASSVLGSVASFGKLSIVAAGAVGVLKTAEAGFSFLADGVKGASDLNEALNKTNVLLGDAAPAVTGLADEMSRSFGLAKTDTLGVASALGALGKNAAGLSGDALGKFSTDLTRLAADVSSIQNVGIDEIGKAFQVALSGEQSDVLKQLGVDTREAAVEQFALSRGIARVGDKLTEAQKVQARAGILTEKLSFASGDLARTINDPANAYRRFTGTVENLGASIGGVLMPPLMQLLGGATTGLTAVANLFERNKGAIAEWSGWVANGIGVAFRAVENWRGSLELAGIAGAVAFRSIVAEVEVAGRNVVTIAGYVLTNWQSLTVDLGRAWANWITNGIANLGELSKALAKFVADPLGGFDFKLKMPLDGFKMTTPPPPRLERAPSAASLMTDAEKRRAGDLVNQIRGPQPTSPNLETGVGGAGAPASGTPAKPPAPLIDPAQLDAMKKARAELEDFSRSFKKDVRTPFEEFQGIVAKGREAFKAGLLDAKDFARLGDHALEESGLKKKGKDDGEVKFAAAAEFGSLEYVKAINRAMYGAPTKGDAKNKLGEDQKRLLQQILEELRSSTKQADRHANMNKIEVQEVHF